jgi:hypothetical protein
MSSPEHKPLPLDYASPPAEVSLVTLATLAPLEAELARAKLEANDIQAFIEGSNLSGVHPLVFPDARLRVSAADAERAREILAAPAPDAADGDYADEPWRCPNCHRKSLEFEPRSPLRRIVRILFFILLPMPIVASLLQAFPDQPGRFGWLTSALLYPWCGVLLASAIFLIFVKRQKHCKDCGWQSGDARQEASATDGAQMDTD